MRWGVGGRRIRHSAAIEEVEAGGAGGELARHLPRVMTAVILRPMSISTRAAFRLLAPTIYGVLLTSAGGCDRDAGGTVQPETAAATPDATQAGLADANAAASGETTLAAVLAMPHRSEKNRARDQYRHPTETLDFFGVEKTHTVVELWPGGGWYTEVLAPYLRDEGQLIVTMYDPDGPEEYYGTRQARGLGQRFQDEAEVFGAVKTVTVSQEIEIADGKVEKIVVKPFDLAPEGTVDVVLTFRNSHGWYNGDAQELIYASAFKALKPGGVFGVVQHRAPEGSDPKQWASKGYLPEETVISAAKAAGFELAEKSEINANANDTKDHPDGVWDLPPSLAAKDKDRDKYLAIGESDRMTLKFVKPQ